MSISAMLIIFRYLLAISPEHGVTDVTLTDMIRKYRAAAEKKALMLYICTISLRSKKSKDKSRKMKHLLLVLSRQSIECK